MFNDFIYVELNMFDANSKVVCYSENSVNEIGHFSVSELPTILVDLAYDQNIDLIRITGSSKYAQLVEFGVHTAEAQKYSNGKIRIEVI